MPHNLGALSQEIGLSLPSDARVLGTQRERGIDDAVLVKLEMTPKAWQALRALEPLRDADFNAINNGYLPANDGWWDPESAGNLRTAQIEMAGGRVLNIGADTTTKPGAVVVYVMNHST